MYWTEIQFVLPAAPDFLGGYLASILRMYVDASSKVHGGVLQHHHLHAFFEFRFSFLGIFLLQFHILLCSLWGLVI